MDGPDPAPVLKADLHPYIFVKKLVLRVYQTTFWERQSGRAIDA